jgi:hypothetical protein
MCRSGRSNRTKHGRPPAPPEGHAEPRSAAGAVGAADRARSGAERRDRTTAVNNKGPAQNGTYACARVPQALSASGSTQHVARGRPLLGDTQLAFRRLLEPQFPVLGDEA